MGEFIQEYGYLIAYIAPIVIGLIIAAVQGRLSDYARETVGAVYRLGLRAAEDFREQGLEWLRSAEGVQYRRQLAESAYDALPATIRGIPIGIVKTFISRDRWADMVEIIFQDISAFSERFDNEAVYNYDAPVTPPTSTTEEE